MNGNQRGVIKMYTLIWKWDIRWALLPYTMINLILLNNSQTLIRREHSNLIGFADFCSRLTIKCITYKLRFKR